MGSLRLLLALLVMASHFAYHQDKLNLGVFAVTGFYLISGYFMALSYRRFRQNSVTPVRHFYLDRALKLLPLYWLVLGTTVLAVVLLPVSHLYPILNQPPSVEKLFYNVFLLPVNYVFEPLSIQAILPHPYVPPSWSLATEMHFYLLVPLLTLLSSRYLKGLLILSVVIHLMSALLNYPNFSADAFGYRFIPGVLQFFIVGILLARGETKTLVYYWLSYALILATVSPALALSTQGWMNEQWLGILAILPIVWLLTQQAPNQQWKQLDKAIGNLAYPLFLVHFLIFYLVEQLFSFSLLKNRPTLDPLQMTEILSQWHHWQWLASLILAIGAAYLLAKLQQKVENTRYQIRGFNSLQS